MKFIIVSLALATAAVPAMAQPAASPPTQAAPTKPPIDAERLALARQAVVAIIPPGTMQRVMKDSMAGMEEIERPKRDSFPHTHTSLLQGRMPPNARVNRPAATGARQERTAPNGGSG